MQHFLSSTNKSFDVTAIVETRMIKNVSLTNNLTMNNPQQVVPFFILLITYHIKLALT